MPAVKTVFVCQSCGAQSLKWQGKCAACDEWNTLVEEPVGQDSPILSIPKKSLSSPLKLSEVIHDTKPFPTLPEVDRVLGGGLVQGSLTLVGGAPGIGKSTLLLQLAGKVAESHSVLYVSGEESESQTKLRADRLAVKAQNLFIQHEIGLSGILEQIETLKPKLVIIDSIQTVYKESLESAPGSVAQVRESAGELLRYAKNFGVTILLVGHITKEGSIAGPRVLEHIVDTVLYLEGESHQYFRILRAFKHRYGGTNEVGIFEMTGTGLLQVANPSGLFLQSRTEVPGSIVIPVLEGHRPILIELQALVARAYGLPKRVTTGVEFNRLAILLAVLEKRCKINLSDHDVYLNVTGALKVNEPAADLAIALAVVSSAKDVAIPFDLVAFGEVGLGGEVRAVSFFQERMREAAQLGFKEAIVPKMNLPKEKSNVTGVGTVAEAISILK